MAVISKNDGENRPSSSKGPSKPAHTQGFDRYPRVFSYCATECMLIYPKGSPFDIFRHYETFSEKRYSKDSSFFEKKMFSGFDS